MDQQPYNSNTLLWCWNNLWMAKSIMGGKRYKNVFVV